MVDRDIDGFDATNITRRFRSACNDGDADGGCNAAGTSNPKECHLPCPVMKEAERGMGDNARITAEGFFSLVLDLMLFWPTRSERSPTNSNVALSPIGLRRMKYRMIAGSLDLNDNNNEEMLEREFHQGVRPVRMRSRRTREWSEEGKAYLRYMKLVCLEFAIWPSIRGMFRGNINGNRALLLSIMSADYESMHGRIAVSYLKQWSAKKIHGFRYPWQLASSFLLSEKPKQRACLMHSKKGTGQDSGKSL